ncbi:MAG: C2H2-type zinc finger protein, partial [bacterium]
MFFSHAYGLSRHLPTHPGIRYGCSHCPESFALQRDLREHKRAHSASGQALCRFCGGTFATGSALRSHARSCKVVKPFKCRFCDKSFGISRSLERHNRKHWT